MNSKRHDYLATACELGARVCRDALWSHSRCNWLGAALEAINGTWTVVERALGPDLYGGTSGIALFLARLHAATGEKLYRTTAIGALNQAWSKLDELPPAARTGFYSGWLGVAYARLVVAQSLGRDGLDPAALNLIESLARSETNHAGLDVISGGAGAIPVLLELHRRFPKDWLLSFALRQGEHLLATARKRDEGASSWKTLEMATRDDLTGFSHGAAGIAWALLELYQATGDPRWRGAAEDGFRYERRWFNPLEGNWADLRIFDQAAFNPSAPPPCSMAWCHGAPGIALSRLRAWEILNDDVYRQEAEAALRATAKSLETQGSPGSGNFSLCHGVAGNAESLLCASQGLDPGYARTVEAMADRGIQSYQVPRAAWPCGVNGGGETPNLLLGLAGIGYFYLRLSNPESIPSVLMIHPPPTPKGKVNGN
ncbi:MAG TPA: lanthionine synthetase LanC family protein [Candidatus Acidoferrales bacterium]|nr:lanthionine synthetase LanC family protein [Candidatus Acidoferrales bacterium]